MSSPQGSRKHCGKALTPQVWSLSGMHILRPLSRRTESAALGVGPRKLCFSRSPGESKPRTLSAVRNSVTAARCLSRTSGRASVSVCAGGDHTEPAASGTPDVTAWHSGQDVAARPGRAPARTRVTLRRAVLPFGAHCVAKRSQRTTRLWNRNGTEIEGSPTMSPILGEPLSASE